MHWAQFLTTCTAFAVVVGTSFGIWQPIRTRRDARLAAKLEADEAALAEKLRHDDELKAAKVVERDTELKRTISEAIKASTEQVKLDMIERIDKSDATTNQKFNELRTSVETLRSRAEATDLKMAVQFGGNGGGIREAINKLTDVSQAHTEQIARVAGKFDQHLVEQGKKQ